jgi:hypothetical protein
MKTMGKETEMIKKIANPPADVKPQLQRTGKRVQAVPKGGQVTVVKEGGRPGQRGETQGRAQSRPVKTMARETEMIKQIANPPADVKLQLQRTGKRVQAVPKGGQVTVVKREDVPTVGRFSQPPQGRAPQPAAAAPIIRRTTGLPKRSLSANVVTRR